ncbi:ALA-interacting subunit 3 [Tritrichomonas foetus]|uniref:ALA-interacting subunit 3 n=1 Tax=Tritrichomonas foetus TaxID=1144522 RepID=A0A1J4K0E8_9EUKA|nr:ALA-interacting subunit 3 [Tritrichomonas foetus]|eukprot:OHT04707.1 ALA-interacting subunit 3 [Tritrichomonas foetus]
MKAVQNSMKGFAGSNFVQQRLWSWRPVFTPPAFLIIDIIIAVLFFVIGALTFIANDNIKDASVRYDNLCAVGEVCNVTLHVDEKIEGKINFYYKLTNFHQNQRRYVISRSDDQLAGKYVKFDDLVNCKPLRGIDDSEDQMLLPCGLAPLTFFNDTYSIDADLPFSDNDIAWKSDIENVYKPLSSEYKNGIRYLEENYNESFPGGQTNQHFIVWMRPSALSTFVKLYAKCDDCTMEAGDYTIMIHNNYPTDGFNGEKWILVSRDSNIGTKNQFFAIACFIVGGVAVVACVFMAILILISPRKRGDLELIEELIRQHAEKK